MAPSFPGGLITSKAIAHKGFWLFLFFFAGNFPSSEVVLPLRLLRRTTGKPFKSWRINRGNPKPPAPCQYSGNRSRLSQRIDPCNAAVHRGTVRDPTTGIHSASIKKSDFQSRTSPDQQRHNPRQWLDRMRRHRSPGEESPDR